MLDSVTAVRFAQRLGSGRTRPPLLGCERSSGEEIEVVAKLSGSDCRMIGIAREAIMALLAADLRLPISEPFLVQPIDGFIDALPRAESALAGEMRNSVFPTFGSLKFPSGFMIWSRERLLDEDLIEPAAEIFAFDALTLNPDRRATNPNCQCNGTDFAIFDHEYGLMADGAGSILVPAPWQRDGIGMLTQGDGEHVLYFGLRRRGATLTRLQAAWQSIPKDRFREYIGALPESWVRECARPLDNAIGYLDLLQDHLDAAFAEVRRVLA
jgi:hypothetical protein